jgi:hypothetical protein
LSEYNPGAGIAPEKDDIMNISALWNRRLIMGILLPGLVAAAMIGSVDVTQASAENDRGRMERHDNGRYENNRGRGYESNRYKNNRRVRQTTVYRERVYVPPPVYYAPPPPPGVSIFFPPIIFRP